MEKVIDSPVIPAVRGVVLALTLGVLATTGCGQAKDNNDSPGTMFLGDAARTRRDLCIHFALSARDSFFPGRFRRLWRTPSDADWDLLAIVVPYCRGELVTPWAEWLTSGVRQLTGRTLEGKLYPEQRAEVYSEAEVTFYDLAQINMLRLLHAAPYDFRLTETEVATAGVHQPADAVSFTADGSIIAPLFSPGNNNGNERVRDDVLLLRMCGQLAAAIVRQEERMHDPTVCDLPGLSYTSLIPVCARSGLSELASLAVDAALINIDNQRRLSSDDFFANYKTEEGRKKSEAFIAIQPPCPYRKELLSSLGILLDAMEQDGLISGFSRPRR